MTISTSTRYKKYEPTVLTDTFLVTFPLFATEDLTVKVDGIDTALFSVTATFVSGRSDDASITLNTAVSGVDVEIYGTRVPHRDSNYLGSSPSLAQNLQFDADVLTVVQQEQARDVAQAVSDAASAVAAVDAVAGYASAASDSAIAAAASAVAAATFDPALYVAKNATNLIISTAKFTLKNAAATETLAEFTENSLSVLKFDNTSRFWTTATGAEIFGSLAVSDAPTTRTNLGLGTAAVVDVIDEDSFATDSATRPPSQQSTAAYVTAQIAAIPAPITGCTFLSTADLASDATADFTLTAGYDAYRFVLQNVIPATDAVHLWVRTSSDGGSTFDAGATGYEYAISRVTLGTSGGPDAPVNSAELSLTGSETNASDTVGSAAGEYGLSGEVTIFGPHLVAHTHVTWDVVYESGEAAVVVRVAGGGKREVAADVDAIRFLFSSGALESGTITLYGFKNA